LLVREVSPLTLDVDEFIRRFLIHVLPDGFHRIRHYGLLANANRADNIALARRLLGVDQRITATGKLPRQTALASSNIRRCNAKS
jgi:hypothetical protein